MPRQKVDPKLAQDIEDDIAELDRGNSKSTTESQPCPECIDSKIGPGLIDAHTLCPSCAGTGKVVKLG